MSSQSLVSTRSPLSLTFLLALPSAIDLLLHAIGCADLDSSLTVLRCAGLEPDPSSDSTAPSCLPSHSALHSAPPLPKSMHTSYLHRTSQPRTTRGEGA